ncbi:hypothetical protein GQ55_4G084500 [Panicum hallii var. hallii]|uniref:Uncharacterized protein n=1 Tax=Panicum hallii var. hallii TaxID=1504633 RepID=A0A2T7DWK4_9POAL|nr:hypothetical protein GQ55_4G084500 [Panicum hallii var. hallii]
MILKPSLPPGTKQLTRRGHNNSSIGMNKLRIHDSLISIHMKTKHIFFFYPLIFEHYSITHMYILWFRI